MVNVFRFSRALPAEWPQPFDTDGRYSTSFTHLHSVGEHAQCGYRHDWPALRAIAE
jgi:hypothetical protein